MADSYYRSCRTCGRRIQLRKMPAGQWVAYEGFDQIHDCDVPRNPSSGEIRRTVVRPQDQTRQGSLDDLDFIDVDMGGDSPTAPSEVQSPATRRGIPRRQKKRRRTSTPDRSATRTEETHQPSQSPRPSQRSSPPPSRTNSPSHRYSGSIYPYVWWAIGIIMFLMLIRGK